MKKTIWQERTLAESIEFFGDSSWLISRALGTTNSIEKLYTRFSFAKNAASSTDISDRISQLSLSSPLLLSNAQQMDEFKSLVAKRDPSFLVVCKAHEFRDGTSGVPSNYNKAAKYYQSAIESHAHNNAEAIYNLALLHQHGKGVKTKHSKAIALLERAASQPPTTSRHGVEMTNVGVSEAMHALGLAYMQGTCVKQDTETAIKWYERAIELHNADSANNLAVVYAEREDPESCDKAERLFLQAHELGNALAADNLFDLYMLTGDPDRAIVWHQRSLANNSMLAIERDAEVQAMSIASTLMLNGTLQSSPRPQFCSLDNLKRVETIVQHREQFRATQEESLLASNNNDDIIRTFNRRNVINLTQILFNDINFDVSHVIENGVLVVKNIDVPIIERYTTSLVVEDATEHVERMKIQIRNTANNRDRLIDKLRVGTMFIVSRPFVCKASDGKAIISVEDPLGSVKARASLRRNKWMAYVAIA